MIVDESSEVPLEFRDDMVSYTSSFIFLQKKSTAILGRKKTNYFIKLLELCTWNSYFDMIQKVMALVPISMWNGSKVSGSIKLISCSLIMITLYI